jgi:hypothetical protein
MFLFLSVKKNVLLQTKLPRAESNNRSMPHLIICLIKEFARGFKILYGLKDECSIKTRLYSYGN